MKRHSCGLVRFDNIVGDVLRKAWVERARSMALRRQEKKDAAGETRRAQDAHLVGDRDRRLHKVGDGHWYIDADGRRVYVLK